MVEKHASVFSLLNWSMRAYSVSWITTFISSIVNAVWMTYVFKFDFLSSIDGAIANQIGIVLLNELYLLLTVIWGWKTFFSRAWLFNLIVILISAAFIGLLIFAPIIAFNLFAEINHMSIGGNSPLYDLISSYSNLFMGFVDNLSHTDADMVRSEVKGLIDTGVNLISVLGLALALFLSFGHRAKKA